MLLSLHPCALLHAQVVPFFFYRGLERLTYSWSDRAFQALFTAVYAGDHDGCASMVCWMAQFVLGSPEAWLLQSAMSCCSRSYSKVAQGDHVAAGVQVGSAADRLNMHMGCIWGVAPAAAGCLHWWLLVIRVYMFTSFFFMFTSCVCLSHLQWHATRGPSLTFLFTVVMPAVLSPLLLLLQAST